MAVQANRRRLTVSHCNGVINGLKEPGELQAVDRLGLSDAWAKVPSSRVVAISSITDKDLKRRKSFSAKDEEVVTRGTGSEAEMLEWVNLLGISWVCRKGLKPESPNQDSFSVIVVEGEFALYCVYDGHGPCGHDVSDITRETLLKLFLRNPLRSSDTVVALTESFLECQHLLETSSMVDASMSGTTVTVVYHDMQLDRLTVAHAGDSRCILGLRRKSNTVETLDLTVDHKPNLEVERKRIESSKPPGRVVFDGFYNYRVFAANGQYPGLNMSRALGDVIGHKEAGLSAVPDIKVIDLKAEREACSGITLLLCTDGVWEFIESQEAMDMVTTFGKSSGKEAVQRLAEESWNRWMKDSDNQISDDISGVLVHLQ